MWEYKVASEMFFDDQTKLCSSPQTQLTVAVIVFTFEGSNAVFKNVA